MLCFNIELAVYYKPEQEARIKGNIGDIKYCSIPHLQTCAQQRPGLLSPFLGIAEDFHWPYMASQCKVQSQHQDTLQ